MSERVLQAIINIDNRTVTIALSDMLGRSHVRLKREYGVPESRKAATISCRNGGKLTATSRRKDGNGNPTLARRGAMHVPKITEAERGTALFNLQT